MAQRHLLELDPETTKDLELFGSGEPGTGLFELLNFCRTDGGARVLRRRMTAPSSVPAEIRATQQAIAFIAANRPLFDALPSSYNTSRTDHYLAEVLPLIPETGRLEFSLQVLAMWANNARHYASIMRGVQVGCTMIQAFDHFLDQPVLLSAEGELAPLLDEARNLLAETDLALAITLTGNVRAWRVLRLDQVFRLHAKDELVRLLALCYEIDALVSLADATTEHGFTLPEIDEGPVSVLAEGVYHPFVDQAVGNPVALNQSQRLLFLSGPNMAGKTTYLRAFATALYFAHLGVGVPAATFRFTPVDRLFTAISLSDDIHSGVSYFRAEALRARAIAEAIAAGDRVVAVLDEPFKGTNVKDAMDATLAIMDRFSAREGCLFMFSSHLIELSDKVSESTQVDRRYFEAEEGEGRLRFDYKLRSGVSSQRLGMRVLREEGVFDLLD